MANSLKTYNEGTPPPRGGRTLLTVAEFPENSMVLKRYTALEGSDEWREVTERDVNPTEPGGEDTGNFALGLFWGGFISIAMWALILAMWLAPHCDSRDVSTIDGRAVCRGTQP